MPPTDTPSSSQVIIFLHILKTAGSTFNNLLTREYTVDNSFATFPHRIHPDGSLERFEQLSVEARNKIDLLYGHMGFGLHTYFDRPYAYLTILRDPVDRIISHYRNEVRDPNSNTYRLIEQGMDLRQFMHSYYVAETDNMQTRMLAGNWRHRGYGPCTAEMLDQAKHNIENHFALIGLTKQFDAFYLLACERFGWTPRFYLRTNVSKNQMLAQDTTAATRDYIAKYNQYDLELYHYAEKLVAAEIHAQGNAFQRRVKRYQLLNQAYQSVMIARRFSLRTYIREHFLSSPIAL